MEKSNVIELVLRRAITADAQTFRIINALAILAGREAIVH